MTLVKLAFIPANELSPASSVVPDDRTATATSCPSVRYAFSIASATSVGMGVAMISSRAARCVSVSEMGSSALSPPSSRASRGRAPDTETASTYAAAVTTKPGGTGSPAVVSSPRLAPFPPTSPTSARPISPNQRIASIATSSIATCR